MARATRFIFSAMVWDAASALVLKLGHNIPIAPNPVEFQFQFFGPDNYNRKKIYKKRSRSKNTCAGVPMVIAMRKDKLRNSGKILHKEKEPE